jgi:AcrR family transcriptional regulator
MYHIKNDKRSIQSSQWIYTALAELMQEKNYEDITVTEIVEKAKLGRATFYRNFNCIDDVLHLKCDETFNELYKYLIEYYKTYRASNTSMMPIFLKPFLRFWYVNSSVIELLIKANRLDIINESFINMLKLFKPLLHKSHDIIWSHLDYFVAIRTGVSINILIQWIKNDKNIAPDDLADLIEKQMRESLNLNLLL